MAEFAAQVGEFARKTKEAHLAIFRKSAQRVVEEMLKTKGEGGRLPIDTGFLRASFTASTDQMPTIRRDAVPQEGATYTPDGTVNLVISTAELGDTVYVGAVAAYARRLEFGFTGTDAKGRNYSQQGLLFVTMAAQKWRDIVAAVEAEVIQKAGLS